MCRLSDEENINGTYAWTVYDRAGNPDKQSGYKYLFEYYEAGKPGFEGRATVPVVVDQIEKKRYKTTITN